MEKYIYHGENTYSRQQAFVRDRFTWFAYLLLGYGTFLQTALGPLAPILQLNLHLSYTSTSIPTGAFAVGIILISLCGEQVMRPWAQYTRLWIWVGGAGMALGAVLLMLSQNILMVAISTFTMGMFGTLLQYIIQAKLADHHRERRTVALTEANVVTSGAAVLAPLIIGGFQYGGGPGWRVALLFPVGILLVTSLLFGRTPVSGKLGQTQLLSEPVGQNRRFPLTFWLYWVVLVCSVAMEWSVIVWSAVLLRNAGLASSIAATAVSLFFVAEVGGRFLGSRLARHMQSAPLLLMALGLTGLGLAFFWIASLPGLKVAGLFLTGLGIANLFPLTLAVAIGITPHNASAASARLSLGAGIAIFVAPLMLGRAADALGIQSAYGFLSGLLLITIIVTLYANHVAKNK